MRFYLGQFIDRGIEQAFRTLPVPVIGRIAEGAFCLDLRCLEDNHMSELASQLGKLEL